MLSDADSETVTSGAEISIGVAALVLSASVGGEMRMYSRIRVPDETSKAPAGCPNEEES